MQDSLFGFDVIELKICGNICTVIVTSNGDAALFHGQTVAEALACTYGEMASDSWMEGDITLDSSHENTSIELWLELISVEAHEE